MNFDQPGKQNTQAVIDLALATARERGIQHIVMASNKGYTPSLLHDAEGLNVVVVTLQHGYAAPNEASMAPDVRAGLEAKGYRICTGTHALSAGERSLGIRHKGYGPLEIVADTLRLFGQGMKVAVEVAVMAADGGYIPTDQDVISIGGTGAGGHGADTAIILKAANSTRLLETEIQEVLCKPRLS